MNTMNTGNYAMKQNARTDTMKAAIFDMDGTLIDSMPSWRRLNSAFVRSMGVEPTAQEEAQMYSMSGMLIIDYIRERYGIQTDFATLCEKACAQMEPIYAGGLPLKPGAADYLHRLHARGVRCVLATATPARLALVALNRMNLVKELDFIYSIDMIGQQKSEVAFYERLCAQIGVQHEECVMFEDSLYAMEGARKAGLGVVGITDSTNLADRQSSARICDVLIDSYDELA